MLVDHHHLEEASRDVELRHSDRWLLRALRERKPDVVRHQRHEARKDDATHVASRKGIQLPQLVGLRHVDEVGLGRAGLARQLQELLPRQVGGHRANMRADLDRAQGYDPEPHRRLVAGLGVGAVHQPEGGGLLVHDADALLRAVALHVAREPTEREAGNLARGSGKPEPEARGGRRRLHGGGVEARDGDVALLRQSSLDRALGGAHALQLLERAVGREAAALLEVQEPAVVGLQDEGVGQVIELLNMELGARVASVPRVAPDDPLLTLPGGQPPFEGVRELDVGALLERAGLEGPLEARVLQRPLEAPLRRLALRRVDGAAVEPRHPGGRPRARAPQRRHLQLLWGHRVYALQVAPGLVRLHHPRGHQGRGGGGARGGGLERIERGRGSDLGRGGEEVLALGVLHLLREFAAGCALAIRKKAPALVLEVANANAECLRRRDVEDVPAPPHAAVREELRTLGVTLGGLAR
mmetsp:Transcript_56864/g.176382  ORF Transcript_56864/g.176382 Transcript_56864/m.176382 type:complete len:470 (-) Transcript_56864:256-1665(-)